jgi:acetoin utilization deacetylase AcuC-like enzyme
MPRKTGFLFNELYMWHDPGNAAIFYPAGLTVQPGEHAENAETKRRFRNLLDVSGLLDKLVDVRPRAATEEEILRVHHREYHDRSRCCRRAARSR